MSKLDDILAPYEFYPDHPFKQEIRDLMLELIGEDRAHAGDCPGLTPGKCDCDTFGWNEALRRTRKKVEEL